MPPPAEKFEIQRAERRQARLRLAVGAASNGGKTWTSLELAFGLVEELIAQGVLTGTLEGKVGMIDTERKSGHLYSHLGPYDVLELKPPYTVERYVDAKEQLERAGYVAIILDSISHAWVGPGGVLSILNRFDDSERFRKFNTEVNPAQDEFVDAMLRSPCHIIATMRSKTAWVMEQKEVKGHMRHVPKRVGMAPIQRPGIEYEFTTMLDLDTDSNVARVVKNRCPVFRDWQPKRITREHGRALARWLLEGAPDVVEPVSGTPFERASATASSVLRACERAANLPDLQRVFTDGVRSIRGFTDVIEKDELPKLAKLERDVTLAKDTRKVALGAPAPRAAGPVIDPGAAVDLELLLQDAGIPLAACAEHFAVARLVLLPEDKLQAAVDWIAGEAIERGAPPPAITKRLIALGVHVPALASIGGGNHHFDDMADDLPWKD